MRNRRWLSCLGGLALFVSSSLAHGQVPAPSSSVPEPAEAQPIPAAPPTPTTTTAGGDVMAGEPSSAPEAAPPAVAPSGDAGFSGPAWAAEYQRARERMVAGDFATAAQAFDNLALTAKHPFDRGLAVELSRLCATWQQRGLVFVKREDLGESTIRARAANERTSDEIASLYLASVGYGIGTGVWLGVQTEPETPAGAILPALGLVGASAVGVVALDSGRPMRYGVPQSIVTGLGLGFYEGLLWSSWNQARAERADEWDGKTVATVIWGAATAGALTGGIVGNVKGTTPGRASLVGSTALWSSAVAGLMVGALAEDDDYRDDKALLAAALGLNAGAIGGMFAAGPVSPSIARVRYLDLGGIGGGLLFSGLYLSAAGDSSDASPFLVASGLGIASGLATAWVFTDGMEKDRGAGQSTTSAIPVDWRPTLVPVRGGLGLGVSGVL